MFYSKWSIFYKSTGALYCTVSYSVNQRHFNLKRGKQKWRWTEATQLAGSSKPPEVWVQPPRALAPLQPGRAQLREWAQPTACRAEARSLLSPAGVSWPAEFYTVNAVALGTSSAGGLRCSGLISHLFPLLPYLHYSTAFWNHQSGSAKEARKGRQVEKSSLEPKRVAGLLPAHVSQASLVPSPLCFASDKPLGISPICALFCNTSISC